MMNNPDVKTIVEELASGAFLRATDDGYELVRDCRTVGMTLVHELARQGWLKSFANGGGFSLSDAGRISYLRSTDEMGDGELLAPEVSQ